jgi:PKHD-type hydroxylase
MKNTHWLWKGEVSSEICDLLVEEFSKQSLNKGLVGGFAKEDFSIRNNSVVFAPEKHAAEYILFRYAILANRLAGWNYDLFNFVEPVQFSCYKVNEFYGEHIDSRNMQDGLERKLTCICLLSDEFDGGEFKLLNQTLDLKKGDVLVFPSFLFHGVNPVNKGVRWSLVGWMSGPKFL